MHFVQLYKPLCNIRYLLVKKKKICSKNRAQNEGKRRFITYWRLGLMTMINVMTATRFHKLQLRGNKKNL
jgi:hypothetical protein